MMYIEQGNWLIQCHYDMVASGVLNISDEALLSSQYLPQSQRDTLLFIILKELNIKV